MISYKSLFNHNMKWEQLGEKLHNDAKTLQLLVLSNKNHQFKFKALIKSGSYILKSCKNNKLKYADTKNCLLFRVYNDQNGDGIRIITGSFLLEFYGQVDEWFEELKLYCIQPNFSGNYQVGNLIGKGTYGKVMRLLKQVYLAKSKMKSQEFAVKVFDKINLKEQIEIDAIQKEIDILRIVQHPRVIQLLETYESETHIFVVYELLKGGELKQMMKEKKLNQEQSISVIYKLIDALSYIHSKNIIHRDLKPENLIFRNPQNLEDIIIADFGLADFYRKDGQYLFARCGTAGYLAPELIMNKPYDYKVDVYSLGIVFYMLLNGGQSPFETKDYNSQLQQNLQSNINLSKLGIRSDCQDLLSKMIDSNPLTRITSQQAKVHPLFHKQHQQVDLLTMKMNKNLALQNIDYQKAQTIQSARVNKHSFTFSNSLVGSPIIQKKIGNKQNYSNTKVQGVDIKKQL